MGFAIKNSKGLVAQKVGVPLHVIIEINPEISGSCMNRSRANPAKRKRFMWLA